MSGGRFDPRIGSILDGRYVLHERLAVGGMGIVYRGERIGIGKQVAVKFLHRTALHDPEQRERFEREATAMSRASHPNLVSVIDHGVDDDLVPYLITEYHAGESLRAVLDRGPIPLQRAMAIARHMLAGLAALHAAGVVHRDLKPANVLLLDGVEHDFVKLLDFGVAKIFEQGVGELTRAGRILGTPGYLAPEQAQSAAIDHRADIYAMGVILFEMVTGTRPFQAEEELALIRLHVEARPPRPRTIGTGAAISAPLERVILKALAKTPAQRFQTARELGKALAKTREHRAAMRVVGDLTATTVSAPRSRRRVLVLALVLVIGIALGWLLRDPRLADRVRGWWRSEEVREAPAPAAPRDAAVIPDAAPPIEPDAGPVPDGAAAEPVDAGESDSVEDAAIEDADAQSTSSR
jgi:serine/threonine protein kinase